MNKEKEFIFTCSTDNTIKIWKLEDLHMNPIKKSTPFGTYDHVHKNQVSTICIDCHHSSLYSGGDDGNIYVFN